MNGVDKLCLLGLLTAIVLVLMLFGFMGYNSEIYKVSETSPLLVGDVLFRITIICITVTFYCQNVRRICGVNREKIAL